MIVIILDDPTFPPHNMSASIVNWTEGGTPLHARAFNDCQFFLEHSSASWIAAVIFHYLVVNRYSVSPLPHSKPGCNDSDQRNYFQKKLTAILSCESYFISFVFTDLLLEDLPIFSWKIH